MRGVLTVADHFARREAGGLAVDLYWRRREHEHEFLVEVEDEREGVHFLLHPATGRDAIEAFHHPFASTSLTPAFSQARMAQGARDG